MSRQEFTKAVKIEIIKRATRDGVIYCELCGLPTKRFDIHHKDMDAMKTDKRRKLKAGDGQLLCAGHGYTCHGKITAAQAPVLAKAKRTEEKHLRATKSKGSIKSAPFPIPEPKHRTSPTGNKGLPELPRRVCGIIIK